jgi:hypothetical protein
MNISRPDVHFGVLRGDNTDDMIRFEKPRPLVSTLTALSQNLSFWLDQREVRTIGDFEARVIRDVHKNGRSPSHSKRVSLVYFVNMEDFHKIRATLFACDVLITVVVLIEESFLIYGNEMIRGFEACLPSRFDHLSIHYVAFRQWRNDTDSEYADNMTKMAASLDAFRNKLSSFPCLGLLNGEFNQERRKLQMPRDLVEDALADLCPTQHCIVVPHDLVPSQGLGQKYDRALNNLEQDPTISERKVAIVIPGLNKQKYMIFLTLVAFEVSRSTPIPRMKQEVRSLAAAKHLTVCHFV